MNTRNTWYNRKDLDAARIKREQDMYKVERRENGEIVETEFVSSLVQAKELTSLWYDAGLIVLGVHMELSPTPSL